MQKYFKELNGNDDSFLSLHILELEDGVDGDCELIDGRVREQMTTH